MTQIAAAQRCSARSKLAAEPMAGTAGHVRTGYLLVEEPGPWAHQALGEGALDGLGAEIDTAASRAGMKALVFRSTGRRDHAAAHRRVFAAMLGTHRTVVTFTVTHAAEILSLDLSLSPRQGPIHPEAVTVTEPLLLVCTHAKRDQCCAIQGLPVTKALTPQHPDRIFECSHLGGHRFAATALSLPSGAVYGRLTPAAAERIYAAERKAQVVAADLRGLSHLPQPAQVVDAELRSRLGLAGVNDLRLLECSTLPDHSHLVRMAAAGRIWRAMVHTGRTVAKPPSCGKPEDTSTVHNIVSLADEDADA